MRERQVEGFARPVRFRGPAVLLALSVLPAWVMAQQAPSPSPVFVARVQSTEIVPTVPIAGNVYSRDDVQITVGVDGQLLFVAEPGTEVADNEIVARVDDTRFKLQLQEQQALAQRARAQLKFLNSQLERQRSLLSSHSTSANQLEQTESDRDVAASDLRIAEVRIAQIEDQLSRTVVRAPFTGIVGERFRREGEDVSRGTIVARLTDMIRLEVRVAVPLKYARHVVRGDQLAIYGYETEYTGTIRTTIPSMDPRAQTFEVWVTLPDEARDAWTLGQLVSVAIPMRTASLSLAVPRDALILRQEGTYVFRINAENEAERVPVEIGVGSGELVAVEGSLTAGERVAIRGAETLTDGQAVTIITAGTGGDAGFSAAN